MKEVWKDIQGYEGLYQVSDLGRVKSLERIVKRNNQMLKINGKILTPKTQKNGYKSVYLCKNATKTKAYIHRLVAKEFLANPYELDVVNHRDENPANNQLKNLEWCSHKYNMNYGTQIERRKAKVSKKVNQYDQDMNLIKTWNSTREAERNGYNSTLISLCCKGKNGSHKGYQWRYSECENQNNFINKQNKKIYQYDINKNLIKVWQSGAESIKAGVATKSVYECCEGKQKTHNGYLWSYEMLK